MDEVGKANTVLQARMMIIPVGDRRLREEAGSPEHATGVYLVRQNPKILYPPASLLAGAKCRTSGRRLTAARAPS